LLFPWSEKAKFNKSRELSCFEDAFVLVFKELLLGVEFGALPKN